MSWWTRGRRGIAASLVGLTCLVGVGCQTTMYDWGTYDQSVYAASTKDGQELNVQEDAARLSREIDKTTTEGKQVPPGKYAHTGYMCYLVGDTKAARAYFEAEKNAFPESTKLMDFLIERLPK